MSDLLVLRPAIVSDAKDVAVTIAAAFDQYRGKLKPESGAFRESAKGIAQELRKGAGAIVAERNGRVIGCVMTKMLEGDLYFGRLAVLPQERGTGAVGPEDQLVGALGRSRRTAGTLGGAEHRLDV